MPRVIDAVDIRETKAKPDERVNRSWLDQRTTDVEVALQRLATVKLAPGLQAGLAGGTGAGRLS